MTTAMITKLHQPFKSRSSKRPLVKALLSTLSLSALLTLSACSGGDNTPVEEPAPSTDGADTAVVEPAVVTPEVETQTAETENVAPVEADEQLEAPEPKPESEQPEVLAADAGAKLYETNCKLCHEAGLLDAPKYGDAAAWSVPLAKDKETLYMHSAKGFNKMPAQAINGVTEAQVAAAVDYMLAAVS